MKSRQTFLAAAFIIFASITTATAQTDTTHEKFDSGIPVIVQDTTKPKNNSVNDSLYNVRENIGNQPAQKSNTDSITRKKLGKSGGVIIK